MKLQTGELVNEMRRAVQLFFEISSVQGDPLFVIFETTPKRHQK